MDASLFLKQDQYESIIQQVHYKLMLSRIAMDLEVVQKSSSFQNKVQTKV
jgi:hypothetical protein